MASAPIRLILQHAFELAVSTARKDSASAASSLADNSSSSSSGGGSAAKLPPAAAAARIDLSGFSFSAGADDAAEPMSDEI